MDDYAFTEEDYDFVAEHGETHLILANRERVEHQGQFPTDEEDAVLISAQAKLGTFETVGEVPFGKAHLSPNHRWLGIEEDDGRLALFDLRNNGEAGYVFFPKAGSRCWSIHPDGEMVAIWHNDHLDILLPDEKTLISKPYASRDQFQLYPQHTFSACGRYLWIAETPESGNHSLTLLDVPSLKVVDRIDAPTDPHEDEAEPRWIEGGLFVWPKKNLLAVTRNAGSSFLSLSFHDVHRRKIRTHSEIVSPSDFDSEPMYNVIFHPSRDRFMTWGSDIFLHEFTWPECYSRGLLTTDAFGLCEDFDLELNAQEFAYCGDQIFVSAKPWNDTGDENVAHHVFDSGTLDWRGRLPSWVDGFLPNGMVTHSDGKTLQVMKLKVKGKPIPVVAVVHGGCGSFLHVLRKKQGEWMKITDVCWMSTPFAQQ